MSTLEIRDVWHRYPDAEAPALRGASLCGRRTARWSRSSGPRGPARAPSSASLLVCSAPRSGQVLVDGRDVVDQPTERRDLTVMFQHPLLFEHLDVAGNVAFAPRLAGARRREARRCAERYLRLVHLEGLDSRDVSSLSGGQQQRVALARALAAERGALLLDEPFSSLDRELRASMHDLLTEVRAALSPTILMVTHDLDEAALAESTVVLIDGSVHQHAPMAEIYQRPATVAVARLLGGFTEIAGTVRDGVHHSAWGRVPVAAGGAGDGDAVLLVRRESLRLDISGVAGPRSRHRRPRRTPSSHRHPCGRDARRRRRLAPGGRAPGRRGRPPRAPGSGWCPSDGRAPQWAVPSEPTSESEDAHRSVRRPAPQWEGARPAQ